MVPIKSAKVEVDVDTSHSCNHWMCCFGCKCIREVKQIDPKDSPISVESVERITHTYERHHHSHHTPEPEKRVLRKSSEFDDLSSLRKKEDVQGHDPSPSSE